MSRVDASPQAVYIKLGGGGSWTEGCIESGTIQLGFGWISHEAAESARAAGDWVEAREAAKQHTRSPADAIRQVQTFYEASPDTIWFTFHRQAIWWCFSQPGVAEDGFDLEPGAHRYRRVDGGWSGRSLAGRDLWVAETTGKLTKKQGYRGTLLTLKGQDLRRLKDRICGRFAREALAIDKHKSDLVLALAKAIETLNEYDFENLADLVLSRAGLQRSTPVGATQKTIDFEGSALFSAEQIHVQVKAGLAAHWKAEEELLRGLAALRGRAILVANIDSRSFGRYPGVEMVDRLDLAGYCLEYGLVDWVMHKAG
jgi:hypothetical protein